jgi:hypothetical protein
MRLVALQLPASGILNAIDLLRVIIGPVQRPCASEISACRLLGAASQFTLRNARSGLGYQTHMLQQARRYRSDLPSRYGSMDIHALGDRERRKRAGGDRSGE